jgi:hypothetical protein
MAAVAIKAAIETSEGPNALPTIASHTSLALTVESACDVAVTRAVIESPSLASDGTINLRVAMPTSPAARVSDIGSI